MDKPFTKSKTCKPLSYRLHPNHKAWLSAITGVGFVLLLSIYMIIPDERVYVERGQFLIMSTETIRSEVQHVRAVVDDAGQGGIPYALPVFDYHIQHIAGHIDRFEQMSRYKPEIEIKGSLLVDAYTRWLDSIYLEYREIATGVSTDASNLYETARTADSLMQIIDDYGQLVQDDMDSMASRLVYTKVVLLVIATIMFIVLLLSVWSTYRKLESQEKNLDTALNSIANAIIMIDLHGQVTFINSEAERLTGWCRDEAISQPFVDVFHTVDIDYDAVVIRESDESGKYALLKSRNGGQYRILDRGTPMNDESGKMFGVVHVFKDVTEEYRLQHNLYVKSKMLDRTINEAYDAIVVADGTGRIIEWNPKAEAVFGWKREEALGKTVQGTIIPHEYRDMHEYIFRRFDTGDVRSEGGVRLQITGLRKCGEEFPIDISLTSVKDGDEWILSAIVRDETEAVALRNELETSWKLLSEAERIAKLGHWELDHSTGDLHWSDEIYRIFGVDKEGCEPSYELFIEMVHPDDRDYVSREFSESVSMHRDYNITHRIKLGGGEVKFVHEICVSTYDDAGRPVRSIGTVQDITDNININNELRLAATTFSTHAGILITDNNGLIVRANPSIEKMTGYKEQELIGKTPKIFQSGKHPKEHYEEIWKQIRETGIWQGELWNRKKNGGLYAQWLTITAVKDESGELTHYVATSQDITDRKQAEANIQHMAYHDELTGLANRRLLSDRMKQEFLINKRRGNFGAMLFLDLDRFKNLNDTLGHQLGDMLLMMVASRLTQCTRKEDIVARMGGDEFVIMIPMLGADESEAAKEALSVAEKIRQSLSAPYLLEQAQFYISVSVGIAMFPSDGARDMNDVLMHADIALNRSKSDGRNIVSLYDPGMKEMTDRRIMLEKGLREGLEKQQFFMEYQPQYDADGNIVSVEALIRWRHPSHGLIMPDHFIPVAEESGLIADIGDWLIRDVINVIKNKIDMHDATRGLRVAINVSPYQFKSQWFARDLCELFSAENIPAGRIEMEMTENALIDNMDDTVEKMELLACQGVGFAIDDFGTGYSSLAYIKRLPIECIKIDRSFVKDVHTDINDEAIVDSIIAMTRHMNLKVLAEGVETVEQYEMLKAKGCDLFQGYYFSMPMSIDDLIRFTEDRQQA